MNTDPTTFQPVQSSAGGLTVLQQQLHSNITFHAQGMEVLRIDSDGEIYWRGRHVETDDELRRAMKDLAAVMVPGLRS